MAISLEEGTKNCLHNTLHNNEKCYILPKNEGDYGEWLNLLLVLPLGWVSISFLSIKLLNSYVNLS